MSDIYTIGLVGSGFGVKAHLPALAAHPRFDCVALASPNSAGAAAAERGIAHAFTSCEEMLGSGIALDGVIVASPPFAHRDAVLAAISKNLHVLCEKPFALNVADAEAMLAASKASKVACGVVHEFRWVPQRTAIKELVANGHLAPLREIEMTHLAGFLRQDGRRARGWWFEKEKGGGMAGALLSHMIDSATWTAGRPPKSATGILRCANPTRQDAAGEFASTVDDGAFALIDYGDGLVARLTVDGTAAVDQFTLAVHAENRTAIASGTGLTELQLFSVDDDETNELDCKPSKYAKFKAVNPHVPMLMELYDAWIDQIETGTSILPTFAEAVATQKVLAKVGFGA
ncbi:MAG TPA: Gfo/Idh/MocA family oxidoreductase [Candidatus Baltobacteraceae bacterium]|jgi:predicted dehydrogenase